MSSSLAPIRVAPSGCYFETTGGEPFLFLGPNDAISWPGLDGLFRRKNLDAVDAYLAKLAAHGVTILRVMLEYAHHGHRYFERPTGTFNPAMVRLWDDLFARCEAHGLRVLLAPWDNFWMALRWHRHPYNVANGGPAPNPQAFFTDEATIAASIRRMLFVVERWGGCSAFAAWDLFNEIHPHWGGSPAEQSAVVARISEAVREAELKRWDFARPQTVSIFGPDPSAQGYEDLILRHPSLDFATTHIYQGAIDYPRETVTPARTMGDWVRHARERLSPGRPFTDTEHGPIHLYNDHHKALPTAFDDEYERHLMWAHLASGGAGSGMRWPARRPVHLLSDGMLRAIKGMAAFAKRLDWRHFAPKDAVGDVTVDEPNIHVFACRDDRQALAWLLRGLPSPGHVGPLPSRSPDAGLSLALRGLAPGAYCVTPWDTVRGKSLACVHARVGENDPVLRVALPGLGNDLALAVTPLHPTTTT